MQIWLKVVLVQERGGGLYFGRGPEVGRLLGNRC